MGRCTALISGLHRRINPLLHGSRWRRIAGIGPASGCGLHTKHLTDTLEDAQFLLSELKNPTQNTSVSGCIHYRNVKVLYTNGNCCSNLSYNRSVKINIAIGT